MPFVGLIRELRSQGKNRQLETGATGEYRATAERCLPAAEATRAATWDWYLNGNSDKLSETACGHESEKRPGTAFAAGRGARTSECYL